MTREDLVPIRGRRATSISAPSSSEELSSEEVSSEDPSSQEKSDKSEKSSSLKKKNSTHKENRLTIYLVSPGGLTPLINLRGDVDRVELQ